MTGDNKNKGFTLVEILIAMTIFSIVITSALGLFGSAFHYQRVSLDSAYLLNSASYITEYISRALRMAKKDIGGICISSKYNFENPGGDTSRVRFLNYNDECQEFYLAGNVLKVEKEGVGQDLTPSGLTVENLHFEIIGESQDDKIQPRVSFNLKLKNNDQELNFQTTVSQRDLDVKY